MEEEKEVAKVTKNSHELHAEKKAEMEKKYHDAIWAIANKLNVTPSEAYDKLEAICRGAEYGIDEIVVRDGKGYAVFGEGVEVNLDELRKDYTEICGYAKENAIEAGLNVE